MKAGAMDREQRQSIGRDGVVSEAAPQPHGIGRRLVLATAAFGVVVTCMVAAVSLFISYRAGVEAVRAQVGKIRVTQLQTIAANVWLFENVVLQ